MKLNTMHSSFACSVHRNRVILSLSAARPLLLLLFCGVLLVPTLVMAANNLVIGGDQSEVSLSHSIWMLEDSDANWSLDDVRQRQSEAILSESYPANGYTRSVYWYRVDFVIGKKLSKSWVLSVDNVYLDSIKLFWIDGATQQRVSADMGDQVPLEQRPLVSRTHVMELPFYEPGRYQLYLRVKTHTLNNLTAEFMTLQHYTEKQSKDIAGYTLYVGFMAATALGFLFVAIAIRSKADLLYAIFIGALVIFHMGKNGISWLVIPYVNNYLNDYLVGVGQFVAYAAYFLLWSVQKGMREHAPVFWKIFRYFAFVSLFSIASINTNYYGVMAMSMMLISVVLFILCAPLGYWLIKKVDNNLALRFFYAGYAVSVLGFFLLVASQHGVVPVTYFTSNGPLYTGILMILFYGLGLAAKIKQINHERLHAWTQINVAEVRAEEQKKMVSLLLHEFRTPLTVIQRSSEMLKILLKDNDSDVQKRLLRINDSAQRLNRISRDVLVADGLQNPFFIPQKVSFQLKDKLEGIVALFREEGVAVTTNEVDAKWQLKADPERFVMLVSNLLENARRYRVAETTIEMNAVTVGEQCEITVRNRVKGMDSGMLDKLKQPYQRGKSSEAHGGLGLGLYLVNKIVESHGGVCQLSLLGDNQIFEVKVII